MDNNNFIYLVIAIVIIVLAVFVAYASYNAKETTLTVLSDDHLTNDDNFTVKLTSEGVGVSNKSISIVFEDSNGHDTEFDVVTNSAGGASVSLKDMESGTYDVEVVFKDKGEYKSSNVELEVEIESVAKEIASSDDSSSSSSTNEPYVIERRTMGDGSIFVYYSDGTYKSYNKDGSYYGWGYESPGDYVC